MIGSTTDPIYLLADSGVEACCVYIHKCKVMPKLLLKDALYKTHFFPLSPYTFNWDEGENTSICFFCTDRNLNILHTSHNSFISSPPLN